MPRRTYELRRDSRTVQTFDHSSPHNQQQLVRNAESYTMRMSYEDNRPVANGAASSLLDVAVGLIALGATACAIVMVMITMFMIFGSVAVIVLAKVYFDMRVGAAAEGVGQQ